MLSNRIPMFFDDCCSRVNQRLKSYWADSTKWARFRPACGELSVTDYVTPPPPQYADTVLKNDIWIGDEAMFLGGSTIENGCVIGARTLVPPNFKSEAYGIYVGAPARLVRFRFSEKVREALINLAWWEMPIDWIKQNNDAFLVNLAKIEEAQALEVLAGLAEAKAQFLAEANEWKQRE